MNFGEPLGQMNKSIKETLLAERINGCDLARFATGSDAPLRQDPDLLRLSELAASLFNTKAALISVFDEQTQYVQAATGACLDTISKSDSFCFQALESTGDNLVVPDASRDLRFSANRFVREDGGIRFYAGVPVEYQGNRIGTLCIFDDAPRADARDADLTQLTKIADIVGSIFHLKYSEKRRREIESVMERDDVRHKMALAAAKVASWAWHIPSGKLEYDDGLIELMGLQQKEKISFEDALSAVEQEDQSRLKHAIEGAIETCGDYECEFRTAAAGKWVLGRGKVFETDADGKPALMIGVLLDISENRKNAESMKLLLKELSHRVKNTLAILQSMAVQSLRRSSTTEEFTAAFSGRLQAISAAHGLLSDSDWTKIRLRDLIDVQVRPFRETPEAFRISGYDPSLGPDVALGLGLIIHELATNAVKHGALSEPGGTVHIQVSTSGHEDSETIIVDWKEHGGPAVIEPDGQGFGSILIQRGLDKVIGSKISIDYPEDGLAARIELPREILSQ